MKPPPIGSETFTASAAEGARLDAVLKRHLDSASWSQVRQLITTGKIRVDDLRVIDGSHPITMGTTISIQMNAPRQVASTPGDTRIVHCDAQIVVVRKPPGLSTEPHPDNPICLAHEIHTSLHRKPQRPVPPLGIVHRLDKVTSGLLVFARTAAAKSHLKLQFKARSVQREYLALVYGVAPSCTIRSRLVTDRGDRRRGSTRDENRGKLAVTHVRCLETFSSCSLISCRLETGRTHQIRIHLSEKGHPIVGEHVYIPSDFNPTESAPRALLHATSLGFRHPKSGEALAFEEPLPPDFLEVLNRQRRTGN